MAPKSKYDQAKLQAVADEQGVDIMTIRQRAKVYENEDDWHLAPINTNKLQLKKGVATRNYVIQTGHPCKRDSQRKTKKVTYTYRVTCLLCGISSHITISTIYGKTDRHCCKRAAKDSVPKLALQARAKGMCGMCRHVSRCSDRFWECDCLGQERVEIAPKRTAINVGRHSGL